MPDVIKDGQTGYTAKVRSDNKITVYATCVSNQHSVAEEDGESYTAIGTATLASGTVTALHIKNTHTTKSLVITHISHQILDHSGGTALPNASNYLKIAWGRTYSSGGSSVTPVNTKAGSGNVANITMYQGAPTLAGTANEMDRLYTYAEGFPVESRTDDALIVPPNQTLEVSYVGDQTAGTIFTRVAFLMED